MRQLILFIAICPILTFAQNVGIGTSSPSSKLDILAQGDNAEVLRLTTERGWVFKQRETGANARLALQTLFGSKNFEILSENGLNRSAIFFAHNTFSSVLLVPDAGEVGIGVADPTGKLQILHQSSGSSPHLRLTEDDNDFARIKMESTSDPGIYWDIAGQADSSAENSRVNFYYSNPGFSGDKVTIRGDGNVGIGTISPAGKLHVKGADDPALILEADDVGNHTHVQITSDASAGPTNQWTLQMDDTTDDKLQWRYNNSPIITFTQQGRVLIGTTLEAAGKVYVVGGIFSDGPGSTRGVVANSDTNVGVFGTSDSHTGVYGEAYGTGSNARGVYGVASAVIGENYGVYGKSNSIDGYGGYFDGKVHIEDNLIINGQIKAPNLLAGDYAELQYNPDSGSFFYDNSSRRFKENIADLSADFDKILLARPVQYTRPGTPDRIEIGYIAEEMEALGLDHLIGYDKDGLVENFNYEKMILYVVEVIKMQQSRLIAQDKLLRLQQNALETLQAEMAALSTQ